MYLFTSGTFPGHAFGRNRMQRIYLANLNASPTENIPRLQRIYRHPSLRRTPKPCAKCTCQHFFKQPNCPIPCRSQETMDPCLFAAQHHIDEWMGGWVEASPELINDYYRRIVAVSVSAKCRKNEIRNMLPTLVFGINENYDSPIVGTEKVYTNVIYYVISVQASIRNLLWFCETMRKTSYPDRILYSRDLIFARACTIVFVDLSYIIVFVPFAMLHDCFCRFSKIVPRRKSIEKRVGMKILWTRISK